MKRRIRTRRAMSRSPFRARSSRKRSSSSNTSDMGIVIGGVVYGAGREYLSNMIKPLTDKLPLGDYADEVALGVAGYFLSKGKIPLLNSVPYSKEIGKAMLTIESARVGSALGSQILPNKTASVSTEYVYG